MPKLSDHIALRARSIDFTALGFNLPNPDPILRARGGRIELYRELRTDAHVGGCIRRRKSAVKALEWGLDRDKARSRVAKEIEAMFADLDLERLIGEAMEAVLYGYQPLEILWQKRGSLIVPGEVIGKPPEWFHFDDENRLRFKTRDNPFHGEETPPMKFLLPRQDATYQNPYGFADLSMIFWPLVFKKGGVKFWLSFTEKFGSAFSVGKLPRSATPEERAKLLDSLEALIQDGVATIPDDGSIELVEMAGKTASADLYERLVMYCRSEVSIALTGTNQTVEANSNKASASAGLEVADDLRDGDAAIVAAAINQLIRWVVEINWGGAAAPVFELWDQEARDKLQAERDKSLKDAGANLSPAYFIRAYKLEEGDVTAPPVPVVAAPAAVDGEKQGKTATAEPEEKPEFAEPTVREFRTYDPLAADAARLAQAAQPAIDSLLATVSGYVDAAEDLQGLQDVLLNAYGDLDTSELARLMAAAYALAELKGIAAVRGEATGRPVAFMSPPGTVSFMGAEAQAQPQEPQQIHIHLSEGMADSANSPGVNDMGYTSHDDLLTQLSAGKYLRAEGAKITSPVHTAGGWHLLLANNGSPNGSTFPGSSLAWQGCNESTGDGTGIIGIQHGGNPGGAATKHLLSVGASLVAAAGAPWQAKLVDLIGYYKLTGTDVTGTGARTLTGTPTHRYGNGDGVQACIVSVTAPTAGGPNLSASSYTNAAGTTTRAFQGAPSCGAAADAYATRVLHSGNAAGRYGPFLPQQGGDTGVRSIQSLTLSGGTAYTGSGVLAVCLVKPLADISIPVTGMWSERDLVNQINSLPKIADGACLAWMLFGTGATTANSPFTFALDVGWGG